MHKFPKNIDASSKYLGSDVYKRSKFHTEVQRSWSTLYVTVIRRLLLAACQLMNVFVCRGKETVIIMQQYLAPPLQRVLDQNLCTPGVYDIWFDSPPPKPVWCGMSRSRNEHTAVLDNQNTSTHTIYISLNTTMCTHKTSSLRSCFLANRWESFRDIFVK